MILLLTGKSGSGKTTIAKGIASIYQNVVILDGDELREGLNSDLGFSDEDIMENMRRVSSLAKLLSEQKYFVVVSMIAPLLEGRKMFKGEDSWEILIQQSKCEERDVKGLCRKGTQFREYEMGGADYVLNVDEKFVRDCIWEIEVNTFGSEKSDW